MSKQKLINQLKKKNPQLTYSDSEAVIDIFLRDISKALKKGSTVEIRGFGKWFCKRLKENYNARNPSTNELFSASKNMGSFYNDERVKCLDQNKESIALVSRSEVKRGLWDEYKNNFKDLRPIGSVAYKLGLIGAGKGDVFATLRPKNEWDICAGHCIINESGGVLFDLHGKSIKYNQKNTLIQPGLIAGSKNKVDSLLKIINI